jgi:hypothetical protein
MWYDTNVTFAHAVSNFTLKTEAAWASETFVSYHITIWRQNLEGYDLNLHRRENLKSRMRIYLVFTLQLEYQAQ